MFSLSFVLIVAGLMFGGATTLIGFGGLLGAWFHRSLGAPLPSADVATPGGTAHYLWVGVAGFLLWGSVFLISLRVAP